MGRGNGGVRQRRTHDLSPGSLSIRWRGGTGGEVCQLVSESAAPPIPPEFWFRLRQREVRRALPAMTVGHYARGAIVGLTPYELRFTFRRGSRREANFQLPGICTKPADLGWYLGPRR